MATAAHSTNVVRLPTAARRKVEQRWNKHSRPVAMALRQQWPGEYIHHQVREAMQDAALIQKTIRTPALAAVHAIFAALDEDAQRRALCTLRIMALTSEAAASAVAMVRPRNLCEQIDLSRALDRLDEGAL